MTTTVTDPYVIAIESVLDEFKIESAVVDATRGPSVTRYEVMLGAGVKLDKVARLQGNIAYATAAESVRILAPIPGKAAVGIELPNATREAVRLRDLPPGDGLTFPVGKGIDGQPVMGDLAKMPHLLVAGTTGSGKSSFINAMLSCLLRADHRRVKLVLIDPKMVELTPYRGVPHLLRPVITEVEEATAALDDLVQEMERRYAEMRDAGVRNVDALPDCPKIVVVVDELADLMMAGAKKRIESNIVRLAQKARAAGIHLVLATQRPSVDVVTGLIKANVPSRLAFATSSLTDSRVVLDEPGAEQLLGMGDGLFKPVGARASIRIQGAYVADYEIDAVVAEARARGDVEEMADRLHPTVDDEPTILDLLDSIIATAERAEDRGEKYMTELCKKEKFFTSKSKKTQLLMNSPIELGAALDALSAVAKDLRRLRQEALEADA